MKTAEPRPRNGAVRIATRAGDPLWYKDAVFYEIRVGAYQDGDGDGIGDLRGLTSRLDYLQDLGVTVLWLLPLCPSPLRDDGYDIADYTDIHPDTGTLEDFKEFLREAHGRGLRVVTELVINHTSDAHPWFQRARRAPAGSRFRRWYVWSDDPNRYAEARIIFKDFERSNWTWDPLAGAYYFHRFYAHQPDLNFEEPAVRREIMRVLDFWFGLGVDGLRLDAVPYLFEREGTNCENIPETHAFLKELRAHVDVRWRDRMLLAEANQWPEDAVQYFGAGDECHMAFHFPLMPRLFMALHMEDRHPILDILQQTPEIPESCQWALFLRNHDELTLEMVTDEERDYMYRVYSNDVRARINLGIRRRLAPLLGNDRRRIELMNALLFSLPGTPILYYGDEIGMGDNFYLGDRNGVRTPMQWSSDRNAGFSTANPQRLFLPIIIDPEYHYETVNVEAQQQNSHSLLNWMKRLIALRKRARAFGSGSIRFLEPSNRRVLAFVREAGTERILVVANLSRFVEYVELDLSAYRGLVPVEMFGHKPFPPIGEAPELLTFGPHAFYWFSLEEPGGGAAASPGVEAPTLDGFEVEALVTPRSRERAALEAVLPGLLQSRRWFGAKSGRVRSARIVEALPIAHAELDAALLIVRTEGESSGPDLWSLPVAIARGDRAAEMRRDHPHAVLAELAAEGERSVLFDATEAPELAAALLDGIARRRRWEGSAGELAAVRTRAYRTLRGDPAEPAPPWLLRSEQSNTTIAYGTRFVLKLFRRVASGVNPDLEMGRFLTERVRFPHVPRTAGFLEYDAGAADPMTIAILHEWKPNEGDAWQWTLDRLRILFDEVLAAHGGTAPPDSAESIFDLAAGPRPPDLVLDLLGGHLESIRLLGRRTAELHVALASDAEDPAFAPERFTTLYQRSLYQSMRNLAARTFEKLRGSLQHAPAPEWAGDGERLLASYDRFHGLVRSLLEERIDAPRIRCHGDLHLGQVLNAGHDFVFIDFEGEPARALGERRLKRSPLHDVAGMLRSFDYAAQGALLTFAREGAVRAQDVPRLEPWAVLWRDWASSSFLRSYLAKVAPSGLVPTEREPLERLLRVLLLEKAVYELGYEIDHRPDWAAIPLRGVLRILEASAPSGTR